MNFEKLWTTVPFLFTSAYLLMGCAVQSSEGASSEGTETARLVEEGVTTVAPGTRVIVQEIDFGSTKRWVKVMGSTICMAEGPSKVHKAGMPAYRPCTHWGANFQYPVEVEIFQDQPSVASDTPFPAVYHYANWHYDGCGPQADMNVLNWYGDELDIDTVHYYVPTFSFGALSSGKAAAPTTVAAGLRRMLPPGATVDIHNNSAVRDIVRSELMQGNPVIALVNGGDHYQVVTGLNANSFHVIDYLGNDHWIDQDQLGLELGAIPLVGSLGGQGYTDDTVITTHYYATPQLSYPLNPVW